MTFCPEHLKWAQNPTFTPLSETTCENVRAASAPPPHPPSGYLFTSKYHQRDFCKKAGCWNVSNNKATTIAKQTYKFQHSWLNKCVTTEMWWPVYGEGEGLFCLLCKKHDTSNPQNKSKFLTRSPVNDFAQKSLKITAVRHNKWTQFQRRCYRGFPCFREPLTNAKESQKMCCWRSSQLRIGSWKKSYLTTSSHM